MYCKIYTILTTDAQLGGGRSPQQGSIIAPQIANFLENLKKICRHNYFYFKPTLIYAPNSQSKVKCRYKICQYKLRLYLFLQFLWKIPPNWIYILHLHPTLKFTALSKKMPLCFYRKFSKIKKFCAQQKITCRIKKALRLFWKCTYIKKFDSKIKILNFSFTKLPKL